LLIFDLPKAVFIATNGAIGILIDTARLGTYLSVGVGLRFDLMRLLLVCVPVSFLGAYCARWVVEWIPQAVFRRVVAGFLLLVGVWLLWV